ncbi:ABC transporter ATP-binding protein [Streptococcus hillyeri]|uniref:ABC transporter ATP-binding protein n=1 Tax=Streptococcus hillyeri TaxID=2282420 RepID=A0A3L9DWU8_9STRE|nr:ABC transporter ATP-binding protein [Streptococcus hillyeri]RLY04804.1 ABC transporter ATP-binding protein [Streptococcus hillyeri]
MKNLLAYFKGYLKETILGPVFKLLEASFELLVPLVLAQILDQAIPHQDKNHLYMMIFLLFILAVVGCVVAITAQYFSAKAAVGYTQKLSQDLFAKIMTLPQEERDKLGTSSLISRMTSDTMQVQSGINMFLRLFLRSPFIVFGAIFMALTIDRGITLWFLLMVVVLFLIVGIMSRLLSPMYLRLRQQLDSIVSLTREQMQGIRVIRAFNQTEREIVDFSQANAGYTHQQLKTGNLSILVTPLTYLVVNVTLVIVIWHGGVKIGTGLLSQGMLVALVNYLLQILVELIKLTMLVTTLNQSFISAQRISSVFDLTSEEVEAELERETSSHALVVDEVTFTYPNASEPSLHQIHLRLAKGQFLGIIGGTGSGKSTFVKMINGLYRPTLGSFAIFQNGQSPRSLGEWRDWVALVPQKAELFKGTIRSNLTLGLHQPVSEDELWQALEMAQASDFVREKDGQLDAEVEAFGRNFSGGQRQRLTIARAILRKAPFLVLDDATSALDYLTESRLLSALREQLSDTTVILISQRPGSLSQADKILVLDKGQQSGLGTHQELLSENEIYQAICKSQEKGE